MVREIQQNMEKPIKAGNAIIMVLIGFSVLGFIFYGSLKLLFNNMVLLPQQNKDLINSLTIRQSVSEECIRQLKIDVQEIKENQKEIGKDIKDILKKLK